MHTILCLKSENKNLIKDSKIHIKEKYIKFWKVYNGKNLV